MNMQFSDFGFKENPFAITPDPRYLFLSRGHEESLAHLIYGTGPNGGFVQLTGEVGTGKTMLVRSLLAQKLENVDIALILNPRLSRREFIAAICDELGVGYQGPPYHLKQLSDNLIRHLLKTHAEGRHTVVVVDEAQNLSPRVLEQVRLLTNLETSRHKLLRIILVGQPELQQMLARKELRQVDQRITARYHLYPLSRRETADYIRHRLAVAGVQGDLFTPSALRLIHRLSGGVPRRVNTLCERALLAIFATDAKRVGIRLAWRAAREIEGQYSGRGSTRWVLTGILLLGVGLGAWWLLPATQADRANQRLADHETPPMDGQVPRGQDAQERSPPMDGQVPRGQDAQERSPPMDGQVPRGQDAQERSPPMDGQVPRGQDAQERSPPMDGQVPRGQDAQERSPPMDGQVPRGQDAQERSPPMDGQVPRGQDAQERSPPMDGQVPRGQDAQERSPPMDGQVPRGQDAQERSPPMDGQVPRGQDAQERSPPMDGQVPRGQDAQERSPPMDGQVPQGQDAQERSPPMDGQVPQGQDAQERSPSLEGENAGSVGNMNRPWAVETEKSEQTEPAKPLDVTALTPVSSPPPAVDALPVAATPAPPRPRTLEQRLFSLWGMEFNPEFAETLCMQAMAQQLRCLRGNTDWDGLLRMNRPALLTLKSDGGQRLLLLKGLQGERLQLVDGAGERQVDRGEIAPSWNGKFLMLWRPAGGMALVGPGSTGKAVTWLRQRLAQEDGEAPPLVIGLDHFDAELMQKLQRFQQTHGLVADGVAGQQTLLYLNNLQLLPGTPTLTGGG